ncbi:MAG: hypothetical protein K9G49_08890 [Taibaiella sp.]|nr:hypothetical protein [Taibaiella sp.]
MYLIRFQVALYCYRYYCIIPALLSLPGCWLYAQDKVLLPLLIMKAATDVLIWYFITAFRSDKFYYYYNLNVSKTFLFITWLCADLVSFCVLLWLTTIIY